MTEVRFYGHRPPGIQEDRLPGRLIVIEGTDGVGRSTQVALLKEWLEDRGYAVLDTGLVRSEIIVDKKEFSHSLADRGHIPYKPVDPNDPKLALTVRERNDGPRRTLPRTSLV